MDRHLAGGLPCVQPEDDHRWLNPRLQRPDTLRVLLRPYPDDEMVADPVGRLVNDPRRDEPGCIEPVA